MTYNERINMSTQYRNINLTTKIEVTVKSKKCFLLTVFTHTGCIPGLPWLFVSLHVYNTNNK